MKQAKADLEAAANVSLFRVKLDFTKRNLNQSLSQQKKSTSPPNPLELDISLNISDLPVRVKKHFITAGIIQGQIFDSSGAFACIAFDNAKLQGRFPEKKSQCLRLKGPHYQSLVLAVDIVETLLDEVVKPGNNAVPVKKAKLSRTEEEKMYEVDYEIKDFPMAAIDSVIVKGIIEGRLHQASDAVVTARGNPHLQNPTHNERLLYLHIQAHHHLATLLAIQEIDKIINEGKLENSLPPGQMLRNNSDPRMALTKEPASPRVSVAETMQLALQAKLTEQNSLSDVIRQLQQYVEGSGVTPERESEKQAKPSPAVEAVSTQLPSSAAAGAPLADIIQQLQQYIGSSGSNPA
uniref:Uncharacterized protein n=1 Tax=Graphocephala atropunctata TaxID=36148 RepID=A0A1B6L7I9_9HEMI